MSNYKVGEASWEEEDVQAQGQRFEKPKPMPILQMANNTSYTIRVFSKPYCYYAKWVEVQRGDKKKKFKLNSSLTADCPLVAIDGVQPKPARYIRVLYRNPTTNSTEYRILDAGAQIYNGIKKIQKIPAYANVSEYDLVIEKGASGAQPLYTVTPVPPTPMSDQDKAIAQKFLAKEINGKPNPDYIDLAERCKPLPAETLRKILAGPTGGKADGKAPKQAQAAAAPVEENEGENGLFEEGAPAPGPEEAPKAAAPKAPATKAPQKAAGSSKEGGFLDF